MGNVTNRVFDSSGPEGKVRGTPQQIIDKYNQLARDAQLAGDRVATENFQQHAEHYLRLLGVAQQEQDARQKEHDARREEQERQNRERQAERDRERSKRQERGPEEGSRETQSDTVQEDQPDLMDAPQPDVVDMPVTDEDSGLVETPENTPAPKPKRPRKPRKKPEDAHDAPVASDSESEPDKAAE